MENGLTFTFTVQGLTAAELADLMRGVDAECGSQVIERIRITVAA